MKMAQIFLTLALFGIASANAPSKGQTVFWKELKNTEPGCFKRSGIVTANHKDTRMLDIQCSDTDSTVQLAYGDVSTDENKARCLMKRNTLAKYAFSVGD